VFQGIHILADCRCHACQCEFFSTLPIGHDIYFPIQFSKDGAKTSFANRAKAWLADPLILSLLKHPKQTAAYSVEIKLKAEKVILVNCIDSCFGHVFTKLWNVQLLLQKHPQHGIIVLIPAQAAWLVPEGVAEIWRVESELKHLNKWMDGLDEFVKQQLTRFNQVLLADTFVHLDHSQLDFSALVKTSRFQLSEYADTPVCITFALRQDRYWHNSWLLDFLFKASVKVRVQKHIKSLFLWRQNYLVNKATRLIKKQLNDAKFCATGIGRWSKLSADITDLRVDKVDDATEKTWNSIYSKSHIIIGVHGSNMLIPTSLAAGFINLTPRYKIENLTEDTTLPYTNRYLAFLGRYLDEFSSPKLVARHAVSMIKDFPFLYSNTEQKIE
jgi:hypothetical protein